MRCLPTSLVVAAFLATDVFTQAPAPAEPPARADAAISGVVVDAATGRPIPDAAVQLGSIALQDFPQIQDRHFTDAKGRFVFANLPAGAAYTLTAHKSGYFDGAYGRVGCLSATSGALVVRDGQWFADATLRMCRPASLSGTVIDERDEPVVGVYVRALQATRVAGRDRWAVGPLATTDDRGAFRFGALKPGRYVVMVPSVQASVPASASAAVAKAAGPAGGTDAMTDVDAATRVGVGGYPVTPPPMAGRSFTYPIGFSGGSSLADATVVTVDAGANRSGVEVQIRPVPAYRISGSVQGPADALGGLSLRLVADGNDGLGVGGETGTALVAADGSFTFANVPEGRYTIEAAVAVNHYGFGNSTVTTFYGPQLPRVPGVTGSWSTIGEGAAGAADGVGFTSSTSRSRRHWARTPVTVGELDVTGVAVALRPVGSVRGRFASEVDPSYPQPDTPRFVHLESASGSTWEGKPRSISNWTAPPGEFIIDGVLPGRYLFRGSSGGWLVKSVLVGGRDHTYTPLDTTDTQDFSDVMVTFTNAVTSLSGIVEATKGGLASNAAVIVFPVEPDQWTNYGFSTPRIRTARTTNAGTFRIRAIPGGEYLVIAVPEALIDAWHEPGFFQRARAAATRLTIAWGQQQTTNVRVVELP